MTTKAAPSPEPLEHVHGDPFERYCNGCFDLLFKLMGDHLELAEKASDAANEEANKLDAARSALATSEAGAAAMRGAIEKVRDLLENSRRARSKGSAEYDGLFIRCELGDTLDAALASTAGSDTEQVIARERARAEALTVENTRLREALEALISNIEDGPIELRKLCLKNALAACAAMPPSTKALK